MRTRMRVLVLAGVLVLGAGCSDAVAPETTGAGTVAPSSAGPTTADATATGATATAEATTPGAADEPTSSVWAVPAVRSEIARDVISGGTGESVISGAAAAGEPLTIRVACRGSSTAVARYALVDARADREGTAQERTFLEGTAPCDGTEHEDGVPAGFSGPVQVMLGAETGRIRDGYAILVSSS